MKDETKISKFVGPEIRKLAALSIKEGITIEQNMKLICDDACNACEATFFAFGVDPKSGKHFPPLCLKDMCMNAMGAGALVNAMICIKEKDESRPIHQRDRVTRKR